MKNFEYSSDTKSKLEFQMSLNNKELSDLKYYYSSIIQIIPSMH